MSKNENRRKPQPRPARPRFLRDYEWVVTRPLRLHRRLTLLPGHVLEPQMIRAWRLRAMYRQHRIAPLGSELAQWLLDEWVRRGGKLSKDAPTTKALAEARERWDEAEQGRKERREAARGGPSKPQPRRKKAGKKAGKKVTKPKAPKSEEKS